jgi:hypothetical protein
VMAVLAIYIAPAAQLKDRRIDIERQPGQT